MVGVAPEHRPTSSARIAPLPALEQMRSHRLAWWLVRLRQIDSQAETAKLHERAFRRLDRHAGIARPETVRQRLLLNRLRHQEIEEGRGGAPLIVLAPRRVQHVER